jgi:hypothetical protein
VGGSCGYGVNAGYGKQSDAERGEFHGGV